MRDSIYMLLVISLLGASLWAAPAAAQEFPEYDDYYTSYIINDRIFSGGFHITEAEIDEFIQQRGQDCAGERCLKDYREDGDSAAGIIHQTAREFAINPYVILVTLQKENSLLTDEDPEAWQYRTAMGYGCPEGADCEEEFFGFGNQVELGTNLLRATYDRACGDKLAHINWRVDPKWMAGNVVEIDKQPTYIGNCATAALYNYTPHRVDSGWIAHDGEHYYGNYNFIYLFNQWYPYGSVEG